MDRWNLHMEFDEARFVENNTLRFSREWNAADIEWWKKSIFEPFGLYPDEFANTLTSSMDGDKTGTYLEIRPEKDSFIVHVTGLLGETGEAWWTERELDLKGSAFAALEMEIPRDKHRMGHGRNLMADLIVMAKRMKLERITIEAQKIGKYAWIRIGFLPDSGSWNFRVKPDVQNQLDKLETRLPEDLYRYCSRIIRSEDPTVVREIASWRHPVESGLRDERGLKTEMALGQVLLINIPSDWYGSFKLNDNESIKVFESYTGRKIQ